MQTSTKILIGSVVAVGSIGLGYYAYKRIQQVVATDLATSDAIYNAGDAESVIIQNLDSGYGESNIIEGEVDYF